MSPSFMKKTMVYLGLLDDEYDEYDDLEDRAPRGFSAATRVDPRSQDQDPEPAEAFSGGMSRVRTLPRESGQPSQQFPTYPRRKPARFGNANTFGTTPNRRPATRIHSESDQRDGDAKHESPQQQHSCPSQRGDMLLRRQTM